MWESALSLLPLWTYYICCSIGPANSVTSFNKRIWKLLLPGGNWRGRRGREEGRVIQFHFEQESERKTNNLEGEGGGRRGRVRGLLTTHVRCWSRFRDSSPCLIQSHHVFSPPLSSPSPGGGGRKFLLALLPPEEKKFPSERKRSLKEEVPSNQTSSPAPPPFPPSSCPHWLVFFKRRRIKVGKGSQRFADYIEGLPYGTGKTRHVLLCKLMLLRGKIAWTWLSRKAFSQFPVKNVGVPLI